MIRTFGQLFKEPPRKDPVWIERALPKGSTWIIGGQMAIGKSWVAHDIAHSLAAGRKLFKLFDIPEACRVLIVDREVGTESYKNRLRAYTAHEKQLDYLDRISIISKGDQEAVNFLDLPGSSANLESAISSVNPDVVILDPISFFLAGEEKSGQVVRAVYSSLYDMIRQQKGDMSFIIFHHFRELQQGADPLDIRNFRGSTKWGDDADTRTSLVFKQTQTPRTERWRLTSRWVFRHDESPPDFDLVIRPDWHVEAEPAMIQGGILGGLGQGGRKNAP